MSTIIEQKEQELRTLKAQEREKKFIANVAVFQKNIATAKNLEELVSLSRSFAQTYTNLMHVLHPEVKAKKGRKASK